MRLALSLLLALGSLEAQTPPSVKAPSPVLTLQHEGEGRKVWHTRRFRIESTAKLPDRPLQRLASVADATVTAVSGHPLPLFKPPGGDRLRIVIVHDDSSYVAEGGLIGSAGMYLARKQCVLLHAQHLFARKPGSRLNPTADEDLVVHEISHLCMHGISGRFPQWLNEGLCEYFASAHRGAGRFQFEAMDQAIREHLRRRFDPANPRLEISPISDVADLKSRQWVDYINRLPAEAPLRAYATALLLTHYHLHGGAARRDQIAQGLSRKNPRDPDPFTPVWGQSTEIQQQLVRYWSPKGLKLVFSEPFPLPPSRGGPERPAP